MRQRDRDQVLVEQRDLLVSISDRLDRSDRERRQRRRDRVLPPIPRRAPRRPTYETFEKVVPDSHLDGGDPPTVRCPCGGETKLTWRGPMMCAGDCGRAFVRVIDGPVRCHQFPGEQEAA